MAGDDKSKKSNKNHKKGSDRADAQPKKVQQQETSPPGPTYGYHPQEPQGSYSSNLGASSDVAFHTPSQFPPRDPAVPSGYAPLSSPQHFPLPNSQFPTQSGGSQFDMNQFAMNDIHQNQGMPRRDSEMSRMAVAGSPKHSRNPSRDLDPVTNAGNTQNPGFPLAPDSLDRIQFMNSKGAPSWTPVDAGYRDAAAYGDRPTSTQTAGFVHGSPAGNTLNSYPPYSGPIDYNLPPDYQPSPYYKKDLELNDDYGEDEEGDGYTPEQTQQPSTSRVKGKPKDKKKHKRK